MSYSYVEPSPMLPFLYLIYGRPTVAFLQGAYKAILANPSLLNISKMICRIYRLSTIPCFGATENFGSYCCSDSCTWFSADLSWIPKVGDCMIWTDDVLDTANYRYITQRQHQFPFLTALLTRIRSLLQSTAS